MQTNTPGVKFWGLETWNLHQKCQTHFFNKFFFNTFMGLLKKTSTNVAFKTPQREQPSSLVGGWKFKSVQWRSSKGTQNRRQISTSKKKPSWGDLGSFWVASWTHSCWFFIGFIIYIYIYIYTLSTLGARVERVYINNKAHTSIGLSKINSERFRQIQ